MNKYECEADYTITYVKQEIIEANSWEEAEDKFQTMLENTDARDCSKNELGWELIRVEEIEE